jgi:hypothetical protein
MWLEGREEEGGGEGKAAPARASVQRQQAAGIRNGRRRDIDAPSCHGTPEGT